MARASSEYSEAYTVTKDPDNFSLSCSRQSTIHQRLRCNCDIELLLQKSYHQIIASSRFLMFFRSAAYVDQRFLANRFNAFMPTNPKRRIAKVSIKIR